MDPVGLLHDLFFDYTLRTVALGSAALGAVSGALGTFAMLRRQSLLGDAISHAALPGIALAFLLTGSKDTLVLVLGAALAGWIGTLLIIAIVNSTRITEDAALGIILSVFFGVGLVLLTLVQRMSTAAQAGLNTFLFGHAATLVGRDVAAIAGIGALAIVAVAIFWKEFKLLSFDPEFGGSLGLPMRGIDVLLTTLLVLAIVIGLQTVGVVLMSAMVVAPAAAARQWTDSMERMVKLSAFFGALAGVTGAILSSATVGLPTGPTVVLAATSWVAASLLLAPRRGLAWSWIEESRKNRRIRGEAVLKGLYELSLQHADLEHGHPLAVLETMTAASGGARRALKLLEEKGLACRDADGTWALTPKGAETARAILLEREGTAP